uniref:Uncharacterized protein n=1 Tax=Grammatophora oceanica TaxID=210454 RepID=A0A7S1YB02_9STRA|mmetsp:Transcript_3624/g.4943  ORF Transcript_3624/g.4943 Transcript_3624/m.4943 type:complete len:236 (+) Transcript_3624:178-885(+)
MTDKTMDDEGSLTYSATSGGSSNQDSIDSSLMGRVCMDDSQETKELEQFLRQEGISPSLMDPTDQHGDHDIIPRTISRGSSNNGESGDSIHLGATTPTSANNNTPTHPEGELQFTIARAPPPTKHHRSKRARTRKKKTAAAGNSSSGVAAGAASSTSPARKPPRPTAPHHHHYTQSLDAAAAEHHTSSSSQQETQLTTPQEAWYAKPWMCGFADALQLEGVLPTGGAQPDKPSPF